MLKRTAMLLLLGGCVVHEAPAVQEPQSRLETAQLVTLDRAREDDYAVYETEQGPYFWLPQEEASELRLIFSDRYREGTVIPYARDGGLARTVYFKTDSAELTPAARRELNRAVSSMKGAKVVVRAYADPRAGEEYNQELTERRAANVTEYLSKRGVNVTQSAGLGEIDGGQGYQRDRRGEVDYE